MKPAALTVFFGDGRDADIQFSKENMGFLLQMPRLCAASDLMPAPFAIDFG